MKREDSIGYVGQTLDREVMHRIEQTGPMARTYSEVRREVLAEMGPQEHAAEGPLTIETTAEAFRRVHPTAEDYLVEGIKAAVAEKLGGASKHDGGKPQLSLIPREALNLMARGFEYGARKYERGNFKKGHAHTRLIDAALRHIYAMAAGEHVDAESGNLHLAHALCSLAMLAYHVEHHPELNDIPSQPEWEAK